MRRVAIQLTSTGGFYGAERALLELASFMSAQGWESHVIALEEKGATELLRRAGNCGVNATAYTESSRLDLLTLAGKLRMTLARQPQAIVHSHGYKPDILLAGLGVPRRLCCVATCHSWYSDTAKMRAAEWLDKRVLRSFDHVVAVSREIHEDLLASGVAASDTSRINNGISIPATAPDARSRIRADLGIASGDLLIVQIGRLASSKRNSLLLEAVARLPESLPTKVLLVGEGDQYTDLVELARSLGILDQVTFCGCATSWRLS